MMILVYALTLLFIVLAARASYVYDKAFREGNSYERAYTMRGVYAVLLVACLLLIVFRNEYLMTM